mmetsp:Transcript_22060/g.52133  ORF Transcript_22060/g.52133 Transcript_22060/m.52133 type:complete len:89 (-) Transcript_22060:1342-1608(-)
MEVGAIVVGTPIVGPGDDVLPSEPAVGTFVGTGEDVVSSSSPPMVGFVEDVPAGVGGDVTATLEAADGREEEPIVGEFVEPVVGEYVG